MQCKKQSSLAFTIAKDCFVFPLSNLSNCGYSYYKLYIMLVAQMPKSKLFVALTTAHNINYRK